MKYAAVVAALVVLAVGTVIEGRFSDRWGQAQSERLDRFTNQLNFVPNKIGDWTGRDETVDPEEFEASHCTNCVSRTYVNREGQAVNVYLVSGSARHVTIHTPDWCYVGAGYEMIDEPHQYTIETDKLESNPEFLTTVFQKEEPLMTRRIRIFWSFSDDGNWRGPRMPKPTYAGRSALYKVYMITELDRVGADIEANPTIEFAREFLPAINPILFDESSSPAPGTETPPASAADG